MAERRMFTKKVTDDDNFMSLSSSAQALYLHLSMSADDDGFCNQVNICMFKAHASVQDLEALLTKRYVYQFDNGVIVIKHWRMANALRKDRYTPTTFQDELAKLQLKKNGSYTWLPDGCQTVADCLPQDRLDKDRLDKDRLEEYPPTNRAREGNQTENADLAKVMTFYMEEIARNIPSTIVTVEIQDFVKEFGADVVLHAMKRAAEADKHDFRYVKAILGKYRASGLNTVEKIVLDEKRYQAAKNKQGTEDEYTGGPFAGWDLVYGIGVDDG